MKKELGRNETDVSGGDGKSPRPKSLTVAMGERILRLRKRWQWSQGELAERLGVTRERVGNWERGENAPPVEALVALGEVLRVSVDELLHGKRRGRWLKEDELERLSGLLAEGSELLGSMARRKTK
ncbi:MAG: helix-turn-helix transcriptional regulator [Thermoanaerobaculia bacterium]